MTKLFGVLAAAVSLLAACAGPEPMYVKEGITFLQYQRDTVSCATAATQAVPSNTQLGWAPYMGFYTADTNSAIRTANAELCLREKGYSRIVLPLCSQEIRTKGMYGPPIESDPSQRIHITPQACYFIGSDMRPRVYSPE